MRRLVLVIIAAMFAAFAVVAQTGLNVEPFFTDSYAGRPEVTIVSMSYDREQSNGVRKYKSFSVENNVRLADEVRRAVQKDGVSAESKEVSYREGDLYFGFYSLGGRKSARRYLLFLNRRPKGIEKSTLIYIEGSLDEKAVKGLIKK